MARRVTKSVSDLRILGSRILGSRTLFTTGKQTVPAHDTLTKTTKQSETKRTVDLPLFADKITEFKQGSHDIKDVVLQKIQQKINSGCADHFMVCELGKLRERFELWQLHMPRVQPLYAIKCNDDPRILEVLASLGCGFDCASWHEIDTALTLVQRENIIFANPCKQQSHLEKAREHNVSLMTFDSSDELAKISACYPEAQCVLRLLTEGKDTACDFSSIFGSKITDVPFLLAQARSYNLDVVGVSFHCGGANSNPTSYRDALDNARAAFEIGTQAGYDFKLLDIGGGFPGSSDKDHIFAEICKSMHFDDFDPDVRIIAQPGRFFVTSAQILATRVFSMKQKPNNSFAYYINDGIYGSLNNILYDNAKPIARKFVPAGNASPAETPETFTSTIFGPTCDSLDCVAKNVRLPRMEVDDWFVFENMGAYTNVRGCEFNGMPRPKFEYVE